MWRYPEKPLRREECTVIHQLYKSQTICIFLIHGEWVKQGAVQLETPRLLMFSVNYWAPSSLGSSVDSFSSAVMVDEADGKAASHIGQSWPKPPIGVSVLLVLFRHDTLVREVSSLLPSKLNTSKKWSPKQSWGLSLSPLPPPGPLGAFSSFLLWCVPCMCQSQDTQGSRTTLWEVKAPGSVFFWEI